jgi:hypothetical protein
MAKVYHVGVSSFREAVLRIRQKNWHEHRMVTWGSIASTGLAVRYPP